jgi:hypothetical protein
VVKFVRITSGRHPYEVALLIAAPLVGAIVLLTDARSRAVTIAMPAPVRAVWVVLLILAGGSGLTGVFWSGRIEVGLSIEAVGVLVLGSSASMYAVAVLAVGGLPAAAAGGFTAAVSAGSWWRLLQIWGDLRRVDRARKAPPVADPPLLVEQRDHGG